jgi:hypothetical protein
MRAFVAEIANVLTACHTMHTVSHTHSCRRAALSAFRVWTATERVNMLVNACHGSKTRVGSEGLKR